MSRGPLELRPGALAHADARWARRSALHASTGRLLVRRGRWRVRAVDVTGATLRPAQPPATTLGRAGAVAVQHPDRGVVVALAVGDWTWLPAPETVRRADQLTGPLEAATQDLARALGVPWAPQARRVRVDALLDPRDPLLRHGHVAVMLTAAVVVACALVLGPMAVPPLPAQGPLVVAAGALGVAAVLGMTPARWWVGRARTDGAWRWRVEDRRAGWRGDRSP